MHSIEINLTLTNSGEFRFSNYSSSQLHSWMAILNSLSDYLFSSLQRWQMLIAVSLHPQIIALNFISRWRSWAIVGCTSFLSTFSITLALRWWHGPSFKQSVSSNHSSELHFSMTILSDNGMHCFSIDGLQATYIANSTLKHCVIKDCSLWLSPENFTSISGRPSARFC